MEQMQPSQDYTVNTDIKLTELENQIFVTLLDVVRENQLRTTLRVAGGWVRDKVILKNLH